MHFQALSVGALAPTHHFSGTVHSAFHQACNARLAPHAMLTLLPSEKDYVLHGIRLNTASSTNFPGSPSSRSIVIAGEASPNRQNRTQSHTFHP